MIGLLYAVLYRLTARGAPPLLPPFDLFFDAADRRWEEIGRERREHAGRQTGC